MGWLRFLRTLLVDMQLSMHQQIWFSVLEDTLVFRNLNTTRPVSNTENTRTVMSTHERMAALLSWSTQGQIFEWGFLVNRDPYLMRIHIKCAYFGRYPHLMWIHIQWGSSFDVDPHSKRFFKSPECHSECTDSKTKKFLIELSYLYSFIFLRWIATCIDTNGILCMKVVLTHYVPAVGFDPWFYGFAVQ